MCASEIVKKDNVAAILSSAMDAGGGILRLAPAWVPRSFLHPGKRIKLAPTDWYALGAHRGGIDERWFASTTEAANDGRSWDEGLSWCTFEGKKFLLKDAVDEGQGRVVGEALWNEYKRWTVYSKFFDNQGALPHHLHHRDEHARAVGQLGKPEAYFFPPQANNHGGDFPYTFFGFEPGTTKEQVRDCLANFTRGDNKLTNLSRAYRLEPGTGWDVPPGILHAPGSLCTYEPQRASDVFAMYQSLVGDRILPEEFLWKDVPPEHVGNVDYLMELIDWDLNLDPEFVKHRQMKPVPVRPVGEVQSKGYAENWICYRSADFSAKELTVLPGATVTVRDGGAYGFIMMQGQGTVGSWEVETPALIRYGQLTNDEFFVSEAAAREGVSISNPSACDPIVMLKHFGPGNPDLPAGL